MALDRAQSGYNPTPEAVQVNAPQLRDITVSNNPMGSKAMQLAYQLGANFDGFAKLIPQANEAVERQAKNTANSMTTDELAAKIKSGELHSSVSPVFNAALTNTYYANKSADMQRETLSKIETGELNFSDDLEEAKLNPDGTPNPQWSSGNQKLEAYLVKQRNDSLGDASKYGVAGFDSHWNSYKKVALANNTKQNYIAAVNRGVAVGAESLRIAIAGEQSPEQISQNFSAAWTKATLPSGSLLSDEARKTVLEGVAFEIMRSGNVPNLEAVLNTKLSSGLTVRTALSGKDGGKMVSNLVYQAERISESNQNRAQVNAFKQLSEDSIRANGQSIANLISLDQAFNIPTELPYRKPDGTIGYLKTEPEVYRALNQKTQGMSLASRLQTFNTNGIDDQETKNSIHAGLTNLNSITYNEEGKPAGQLNPNFKQAFDSYLVAKSVDPAYATRLAGTDGAKTLEDIELLKQTMGMDLNGAALVVAQARNNPTYISGNTKVTAAADKVVANLNPSWFGRMLGTDELSGNIDNIRADVKRSAEVMIAGGASVDTTMKALGEYVEKNVMNINGSLVYLRSIPTTSRTAEIYGGSATQIKRFVSEIGTDVAIQQGFDPSEVKIAVSKDGTNYTFMARNQPLMVNNIPLIVTKPQLKDWMERDFDNWKTDQRLEPARKELASNLAGTYMSTFNKPPPVDAYLGSPTGYRRLVAAGLEKSPIATQREWSRQQILRGASLGTPATPLKDYSTKEVAPAVNN